MLALAVGVVAVSNLSIGAAAARFGAAVKVMPNLGYGYEPAVVVESAGNIYVTAHKENWQLWRRSIRTIRSPRRATRGRRPT